MYWLSTGQKKYEDMAWWQVDLDNPVHLAALKVSTRSGPYRVYVSIDTGDGLLGKKKIPYTVSTGGVPLDAKIKFVMSFSSEAGFPLDVTLPKAYQGVTKIRAPFPRLPPPPPG